MILSCFHHGETPKRWVFENGGAEIKVEGGPKDAKSEAVPVLQYDPGKKTAGEVWKTIDEKYGKDPYQALIAEYVDKLMPKEPEGYKAGLLQASTQRYNVFYVGVRKNFIQKANKLESAFDTAVGEITIKIQKDLSVLKSGVEGAQAMAEFKEPMPQAAKPGEPIPVPIVGPPIDAIRTIERNRPVREHFNNYLNALNARYFNVDVNEGTPIPRVRVPIVGPVVDVAMGLKPFQGRDYEIAGDRFKSRMSDWVSHKLNFLLQNPKTTSQDLEQFRTEISDRYRNYSSLDKNSAIISKMDLDKLDAVAFRQTPDAIGRILDERDDQVIKRLEVVQLLNPDGWESAVQTAGDILIRTAINNNSQDKFVLAMNKYHPVKSFSEARNEFKDMLGDMSKVGVPEALTFLRDFNTEAHGEVLQFEREVKPPALAYQVDRQMDYLLKGYLKPEKETDAMLIQFMSGSISERKAILDHPGGRDKLFRAIRQATEQYPDLYDQQYGSIPDDVKKLKYSPRIEKPTTHDKAAQLQALIIMGNQAKVIVSQLSHSPDYAGQGLVDAMNNAQVPADIKAVVLGGFKGPKQPARFRSALDHGGFNGRDLLLKGGKVLGALTVAANIFQSFSETSSDSDFLDRVTETLEKTVTNQGVIAGAAVAAGAHMAERNSKFLSYPWLSPHERSSVMTVFKLDNMGAKVGKGEVDRFLGNNAEWQALAHPALDPETIKGLLKQAGERAQKGEKPIITWEDLKKSGIDDESIITTLTGGGRSDRMRYLFYENFFSASVKPDVNHVRQICTGSSTISKVQ